MDKEDKRIAEDLAAGLMWLSREGRHGAEYLATLITSEDDRALLQEAINWIEDISEGKLDAP